MNTIETNTPNVDIQRNSNGGNQAIKTESASRPPEGASLQGAVQSRENITDREASGSDISSSEAVKLQESPASEDKSVDKVSLQAELEAAVADVNQTLKMESRRLEFSIDEKSGETVVVVKDGSSGETIRSIPPESMLRIANTIQDLRGLLYDDAG